MYYMNVERIPLALVIDINVCVQCVYVYHATPKTEVETKPIRFVNNNNNKQKKKNYKFENRPVVSRFDLVGTEIVVVSTRRPTIYFTICNGILRIELEAVIVIHRLLFAKIDLSMRRVRTVLVTCDALQSNSINVHNLM